MFYRATATIELEVDNQEKEVLIDAAIGNGPVDAIFKAVNRITKIPFALAEYEVRGKILNHFN